MLAELRRAAAAHGGNAMALIQWTQEGRHPSSMTIYKSFGSWADAWAAAGVAYRQRNAPISDEEYAQALRDAAKRFGGPVTQVQWNAMGLHPHIVSIVLRYGSWEAAWRAVGLSRAAAQPAHKRRLTPEEMAILRDGGVTLARISEIAGVSRQQVHKILRREKRGGVR